MITRYSHLLGPIFALGCIVVEGSTVQAFWPCGHRVVQKQVYRGPAVGAIGVPVGTTGVVGTRRESAIITTGLSGSLGSEFSLLPSNESAVVGGSRLRTLTASESAILDRIVSEAGTSSTVGKSLGGSATTATTATTACPELVGRLDKIEKRMSDVEDRLKGIETKVDRLIAEREKQTRFDEQRALAETILKVTAEQQGKTNAVIGGLFAEALKDPAQRDKAKVDALLKALNP